MVLSRVAHRSLHAVAATLACVTLPLAATAATFSDTLPQAGVVWISDAIPALPAERPAMRQTAKAFVPDLLVVPVGTSVVFPNDDSYLHSVYSESGANAFDLGLYDTGPGKAVTFATAGIVEIRCHVHASMRATLIVVDGPFARTTAPNQTYRLTGVKPGRHTLHVWTAEQGETTRTVVVR